MNREFGLWIGVSESYAPLPQDVAYMISKTGFWRGVWTMSGLNPLAVRPCPEVFG